MGKMVGITEFKAKCLALLDEMERSGEPLTITRRGRPSLTLSAKASMPPEREMIFGAMKGTARIIGDLDEPLDPDWEEKWLATWDDRLRDGAPVTELP